MHKLFPLVFISAALLTGCTTTGTQFGERADVQAFIQKVAVKDHFSKHQLTEEFDRVNPRPVFTQSISKPKETSITWPEYRAIFLTPEKINSGVKFWNAHAGTLELAQAKYGVDPEIIVGIIGVETDYGKYLGKYRVMDSLSTLAFEYPHRQVFFQHELEEYLLLTRDLNIDPLNLYGSYAGAIGLPQFMPSNYRTLAVSTTHNAADLWNNPNDAILSVANYFQHKGWQPNLSLNQKLWVIKRYNDSDFYARAVYELGETIKHQRNTDASI